MFERPPQEGEFSARVRDLTPFGRISMLVLSSFAFATHAPAEPVAFNRDVRPILSDNCFHCHGPAKQQKELRLDSFERATADGAIVPGRPSESLLIKRITAADDPSFRMPPRDSNRSLDAQQIDVLRKWIAEGALYEPHWSFVPVRDVDVPRIAGDEWAETPLDAFVYSRLVREGIEPSPEADRETLLRRVTLDLTGLPPSISNIDAFVSDRSPGAYEKVVDRLLASDAYGERMASDWLDAARYADTFGYQNDLENRVWPWRDWVIRAFNQNLPYDKFALWQLAGDLLPNPTQEQRVATAFNRLHRQTNEGGSIDEEFRVEYVVDRTNTFATAFLGLTLECARCHDHKFDPISQEEYYGLFAFFNNIDESGIYSHFTDSTPSPGVLLYDEVTSQSHRALKAKVEKGEAKLAEIAERARAGFEGWLADETRPMLPIPDPLVDLPLDDVHEGATANVAAPSESASVGLNPNPVEGAVGMALEFSGENWVKCEKDVEFERCDPFTLAMWIRVPREAQTAVLSHRTMASSDAAGRGYEVSLEDGKPVFALTHFWPGNAIRIKGERPVPVGRWTHLAATYDGSSRAQGLVLYVDGYRIVSEVVRNNLYRTIRYVRPGDTLSLTLAQRFRDHGFKGGAIDEFMVFDKCLTALEVSAMAGNGIVEVGGAPQDDLLAYYLNRIDGSYQGALSVLRTAREAEQKFVAGIPELMTMEERPGLRLAYVLERGAYDGRAKVVEPGTPGALFPFADNLPRNRLGLARWLLDPQNPLPSRVAVNRFWQTLFGRGLVETQEDFGSQGKSPSHPDLLDYLAGRFVESGWDVKALYKTIVLSATYRQASTPRPELTGRDPANVLLWRGPRHRLSAEQIRDGALASSGLLSRTIGGPSVRPYQPPGVWKDASQVSYEPGSGSDLYRRSLYTFWKRTVPPPSMMNFDAAEREFCQVRRSLTTTPLQALTLLNDTQYVEAARVLAEDLITRYGRNIDDRITDVFRRLTGHRPSPGERAIMRRAFDEQLKHFRRNKPEAAAYAAVGDAPRAEGVKTADLAATTALVQMVMNFDDFQVKK